MFTNDHHVAVNIAGKAKVSIEVIAEIINSFTEPISYKTMHNCFFFSILTVASLIFYDNLDVYKKNHTRFKEQMTGQPEPMEESNVHNKNKKVHTACILLCV
ncbi:hypothetical protein BCV71DRAFT_279447 [Rhizopus microsporus]|uniref:Brl1/Brr6 domain-containing protein n=1 Tax=Rhizopus microsporus TaxID=58291 RepID=A0A1X0S9D0_RHIZD|nr:hypothetical protein BCV71DRAFT_279447 [Rhizopus microsporus]